MKLDRNSCRKIEYVTIPNFNDSRNITCSWFVYFSTNVPTKNEKSLAPLSKFG